MTELTASPQQAELIRFVQESTENFACQSGAGTGKTSSLKMTAHAAGSTNATTSDMKALLSRPVSGGKIVAMAFSKKIAVELQRVLPSWCEGSTYNSFGHRNWMRKIQPKVVLDEKKAWLVYGNLGLEYGAFPDFARMLSLSRSNCILPSKRPGQPLGIELTEDWVEETLLTHGLDSGEHTLSKVTEILDDALAEDIDLGWRGCIDFDDQIYLPAIYGPGKSDAPLMLVDESQDLNPAQLQLTMRLHIPRYGFFGDPNQSIFAFRGAMPSAFDECVQQFNCTVLPLNVSFRCPKAVVREAQTYVPEYYAADTNIDGIVQHIPFDPLALPKPLTILCRNNAPLVNAAYSFLKEGIGVNFVGGQDMAKQLLNLIKKLPTFGASSLETALETWELNEAAKLQAKGKDTTAIHDRADTLRAITERVGWDFYKMNAEVNRMFNQHGIITLSTIHKAKGLEWPDVALLEFGLIGARARSELAKIQERNLAYVAITRAQRSLSYLT